MNVGYGCNIYLHADARIWSLDSLRNGLVPFFLLGAIIISNAPPFLLLNKVL